MIGVIVAGVLAAAGPQTPIASYDDLGKVLSACFRGNDPGGMELAIRFTLTARGTIAGKPAIVPVGKAGPMAIERGLKTTVMEGLRRCTPFVLTPDFAQVVAGHPITIRVLTGGHAVLV